MSFRWWVKLAAVILAGGLLTSAVGLAQQPTIAKTALTESIQTDSKTNAAPEPEAPEVLLLASVDQLTPLDQAYLDTFSILKGTNTCSAFFGGPAAIEVLNKLKQQLKDVSLDSAVAVKMSGKTTQVTSFRYPFSYRLFDKAALNVRGPFYRRNPFGSDRSVPIIGGFLPNTREARVTILLHELGHLIARQGNHWLLPDDGTHESLSRENTERVIAVCGIQIRYLSRISFVQELQPMKPTLSAPVNEVKVVQHRLRSVDRTP